MWKTLFEASKEPLRLLVLSVIPVLLVYLEKLPAEWAVALVLVLRLVDKYLHLMTKENLLKERNEGFLGVKGLVGF